MTAALKNLQTAPAVFCFFDAGPASSSSESESTFLRTGPFFFIENAKLIVFPRSDCSLNACSALNEMQSLHLFCVLLLALAERRRGARCACVSVLCAGRALSAALAQRAREAIRTRDVLLNDFPHEHM